jgi:hypothetical protein
VAAASVAAASSSSISVLLVALSARSSSKARLTLVVDRAAVVDDARPGAGSRSSVSEAMRMLPASGSSRPREHLQQRRLAGAVRPREADAVALLDVPRDVVEQDALRRSAW